MQDLHVGSGTTRGALTVFPVWGEGYGVGRSTSRLDRVRLGELEAGPRVELLSVTNDDRLPVLLFEGQVLEGGWQTRMVARSVMVGPGGIAQVEVVCVEQGRWGGGRTHRSGYRRGSARVRGGLRSDLGRQDEVWARVAEYNGRFGTSGTASYAELADHAGDPVAQMTSGMKPLPGQLGLVVAIAGQAVVAEVFDTPATLRRQYRSLVEASALDALGQPAVGTPSRRARRLVDAARRVRLDVDFAPEMGDPRLGIAMSGRSEHARVSALQWNDHDLHLVIANPKHPLNA